MASGDDLAHLYAEIAAAYERRGQGQMRDRFLVLAADAALATGRPDEAERLRRRLLSASPHHLLKPYATFTQALQAPDVLAYVQDLRKNHPPRAATELLATLKREDAESGDRAGGEHPPDLAETMAPRTYKLRAAGEDHGREEMSPPPTMPPGTRIPGFPLPGPAAAKRPAPTPPAPTARPRADSPPRPSSAAPRPTLAPVSVLPERSRVIAPAADEDGRTDGSWLAALLFGILVTAAVVLFGYTFVQPLLP